jgi:flagellar biosynthesis chaperone FliJ
MSKFTYRLQLLLERKEAAKKDAERELARGEQELQSAIEVLESLQRREKELIRRRTQLRRELLSKPDSGDTLTAGEVLHRSQNVKALGLHIEEVRSEVLLQHETVEQHELRVEQAKARVADARREVEVLTKHRTKQQERFLRDLLAKEELALDEVGNLLYTTRRRTG